ncbi:MAG: class I SAM-dependent methyltransferase [Arenicellales bacterium]
MNKWNKRYSALNCADARPASVLKDLAYFLPDKGKALDIACGLGGNAIFMAKRGLNVAALDASKVAIEKLNVYCAEQSLSISAQLKDVEKEGLSSEQFDVITVSYFLYQPLMLTILKALAPQGLLFYQTWTQQKITDKGPSNPDFLLAPQALRHLADDLEILFYQESGLVGDTRQGFRNEAMLVARNA